MEFNWKYLSKIVSFLPPPLLFLSSFSHFYLPFPRVEDLINKVFHLPLWFGSLSLAWKEREMALGEMLGPLPTEWLPSLCAGVSFLSWEKPGLIWNCLSKRIPSVHPGMDLRTHPKHTHTATRSECIIIVSSMTFISFSLHFPRNKMRWIWCLCLVMFVRMK